MNTDWFEITTDPNDWTHIEMRRLSPDEAKKAKQAQYERLFEELESHLPLSMTRFAESMAQLVDSLKEIPLPPDEKAAARKRSKDDLNRKRKELFKRR